MRWRWVWSSDRMGRMNFLEGLPLIEPTPEGWVDAACADLDALLADHAHCELKAAATAISLVGRHPDRTEMVRDLTSLAREEMKHFDQVHAKIRSRGQTLRTIQSDRYVKELRKRLAKGRPNLEEQLLMCTFIEARS